jgi:hypothetical protein
MIAYNCSRLCFVLRQFSQLLALTFSLSFRDSSHNPGTVQVQCHVQVRARNEIACHSIRHSSQSLVYCTTHH